jgi:hypothetical protein
VEVEVLYLFKTHMGHIAVDMTRVMAEVDIIANNLICCFKHQAILLSLYIFLYVACQVLLVVVMGVSTHQVMVAITYLVKVMYVSVLSDLEVVFLYD